MSGPRACALVLVCAVATAPATTIAQPASGAAPWLADRGDGVRTSIFATYVRPREVLVSPFVEAYIDDDFEYSPAELGHGLDSDFRGRYRAGEALVFVAYGIGDRLAIELEAAVIRARLERADDDPSTMPATLEESGQGDWQVQLDWRMLEETARRPEVFGFVEVVPPSNRNALLIGTPDWEFKAGGGLTRWTRFGTFTARLALGYDAGGGVLEAGEYAVEYLKRSSPRWRWLLAVEGSEDEVEAIGEAQWHFRPGSYLRLNTGRGLTSKATDWAPDIGLVFALPMGRRGASP